MIPFEMAARLAGVASGELGLIGPEVVQIDLTDRCPNNCIGCWARSPFLRPEDNYDGLEKGELETDVVIKLLDELEKLRVNHIFFGGGGEPFAHPDVMRIIEEAKKRRFFVTVNTNFLLMDPHRVEWLFSLGIDELIISLWAATAETYALCHPNQTPETFGKIIANIQHLQHLKRTHNKKVPRLKLYNVICNLNYREIPEMAWLGHHLAAEKVEYAAFDPIPRRTDHFMLQPQQIADALKLIESVKDVPEPPRIDYALFVRRLKHPDAVKGAYDNGIYFNLHCFAGWFFARITTTGELHSCLKSHRIPVGNIHEKSFAELWNSPAQREFRRHTFKIDVNDPYLRKIGHDIDFPLPGCFRICDNIGQNELIQGYWKGLSAREKMVVERIVSAARQGKSIDELEEVYRKAERESEEAAFEK